LFFYGFELQILEEKGGYYDPPYCAEFQIQKKTLLTLRGSMVLGYQHRPTFVGDFTNIFQKMKKLYLKVLHFSFFSYIMILSFRKGEI
jgi:hypothetical protein